MILITGAGGKTGRALIRQLSAVESVCALVRRYEQEAAARSLGAEKVVVGDLRQETAVREAMAGIRAVYHICPNMSPDEVDIGRRVLVEARQAGAEHFVYHSVLHPQTETMNHHWQKLRMEELVFEADLPFTILQPAPYMQNLLAFWKDILRAGVLRIPYSVDTKFSFLDLEDLARVAKTVFTESNHRNAVYELAGTVPISHTEVASTIAGILQRPVRAEKENVQQWRARTQNMSEYMTENLVKMFAYYDRWGLAANPNVLRWLLKGEPTSLEAFVHRTVEEAGMNP